MSGEPVSKSRASLVRALHRRKGRREHGAFLAEGERTLEELARGPAPVRFGIARPEMMERLGEIFPGLPSFVVDSRLESLFATESAQGLAVVVDLPETPSLADLAGSPHPLIALDAVADPGNVGTIIRSVAWFGLGGIVLLPGCADPFNPKSVRASMGSILRVSLATASIDELLQLDRPLHLLDAAGEVGLGRDPLPRRASYVIGSEAHGISPELMGHGASVAIGGSGGVESLNAAIAASILCYELARVDE